MKALSIKQPYAELILSGRKKIELRNWNTKFRGEFLIHSPKTFDFDAFKRFNLHDLQLGGIVGKARLVDVKKYENNTSHALDNDLHLANFSFGNYGFVLENPVRLNFIPFKGKLNFFEVELK